MSVGRQFQIKAATMYKMQLASRFKSLEKLSAVELQQGVVSKESTGSDHLVLDTD